MGSSLSCDKCPTAMTSSVVNLSDSVILRVADGVQNHQTHIPEPASPEDQSWMDKIKCIDESHSSQTGLNMKDLEWLIVGLEGRLRMGIAKESCFSNLVKDCYRHNHDCPLRCMKESRDFIDCTDAARIEHIKKLATIAKEKAKVKAVKQTNKKEDACL